MFRKVLLCLHCKPDRSSGISHEVWLEESHCMWVIALSLWLNDTHSKVNKNCQKFCSVNQISALLYILKGEGFFFSYDFFNNDIPHFCLLGRKKTGKGEYRRYFLKAGTSNLALWLSSPCSDKMCLLPCALVSSSVVLN